MEANTFATTIYARTSAARAFAYLRRLQNLDEWTLGSRMVTRIDEDTWMGTASGYQAALCYHVRTLAHPRIPAIEWQCGYRWREPFKQYPVFVFPARYADPAADDDGSYIHWISAIDPARRTEMIMQGIAAVHHYEGRGLKAALERAEGLAAPAAAGLDVLCDTMWVDAPVESASALLADPAALPAWAPHLRAKGTAFEDAYGRTVEATFSPCDLGGTVLIEQDFRTGPALERRPIVLLPCTGVFGPEATGFLLHRIAFVPRTGAHVTADDLCAESMAIKRILEARAGNTESFARGMSYRPRQTLAAPPAAPPDIFSREFAADPYPSYRAMRDDYPLYFHPVARAWILSRYEDVKLALHDPAFTTRSYAAQTEPLLGRTLIQLDGREHSLQRSLLTPSFREGSLRERFGALITGAIDELTAAVAARGEADLVSDVIVHVPVRLLAGLLGLPPEDRESFRTWYTALIRGALNLTADPAVAHAATRARDELEAYLRPLIEQRRACPGGDLLSTLAGTTVEGAQLTADQILRFALLMVFAAGETTEKGLATTLRNLLAHPDVLAAVRLDRALLPRVIAESFRFTAPTHMVPRQTQSEVRVSGGLLPAGAEVLCFLGSANRDERRFADPDRFDPSRPEADPARAFTGAAAHLAFGGGRHFCLGAVLSRFEIELALGRILDALPGFELQGEVPPDVGLFLRGPATLPVRFARAIDSSMLSRCQRPTLSSDHAASS